MPRTKSEAEARRLMGEAARRANSVSPLRTTSLTHMGLKQGRKETHHEPHRWWTEAERAEKTSPGDCARDGWESQGFITIKRIKS